MTLLFVEGFDLQDGVLKGWSFPSLTSGWVYDTSTPFGSGFALRGNRGGTTNNQKSFTASAHIYLGFAYANTSAGSASSICILYADSGATTHIGLVVSAAGAISLWRGTSATVLATSATTPYAAFDGSYHYIEFEATIADAGGIANVRVDGTSVITFTGDTRNAGTSTNIDAVALNNASGSSNATVGAWFDDIYLCNSLGSTNNGFLGPWARVQTLLPNGAGSSTQFTPVSGANYTNVNDNPDNTASYVSDTVSGHRDTYAMADLVAGSDTILGVQQVMHARQLDGGTATIKQAQKSGATVSYGTTKTLSASNAAYTDIWDVNPATSSAYTQTEVNALEAGAEIA